MTQLAAIFFLYWADAKKEEEEELIIFGNAVEIRLEKRGI